MWFLAKIISFYFENCKLSVKNDHFESKTVNFTHNQLIFISKRPFSELDRMKNFDRAKIFQKFTTWIFILEGFELSLDAWKIRKNLEISRLAPLGFGISSFKIGQLIYVILVCVRTYHWNLFWNLPLVLNLKPTKTEYFKLDTNGKTINIAWNCESFNLELSTSVKTNICITASTTIVHPSYE